MAELKTITSVVAEETKTKLPSEKEFLTFVLGLEEVKTNPLFKAKGERMLETRTSSSKTETPRQKENRKAKSFVVKIFHDNRNTGHTSTEIVETIIPMRSWKEKMNVQRMTTLLSSMIDDGIIERYEERKVPLFRLREDFIEDTEKYDTYVAECSMDDFKA